MQLNEVTYQSGQPIDGYGPGFFRVGGQLYEGAIAVLPESVRSWGGLDDRDPLLAQAGKVDVLLFGMGPEIAHLPQDLRARLEEAGLGAEVMSTPQACRSYNVLLGEGRRVGAALLVV